MDYGSREDVTESSLGCACPGEVRGTSQTKGGDDVAARETKDTHQHFNNIACSVILS